MDNVTSGTGVGLLSGKTCVVMGVANRWSIAYAIAEAMAQQGAKLAITYLDDRTKREADALVALAPGSASYQCDVQSDEQLDTFGEALRRDFGSVNCLVHSIGFAPPSELKNPFLETTRNGFQIAHDISVYSLIGAAQRVVPLMEQGGSIITLTYLGSQRAFPQYNVMGVAKAALEATVRYLAYDLGDRRIRVNAISAGPIKTAAARGIPGFSDMQKQLIDRAPLKDEFGARNVASTAVFLASDGASAITGETLYVDNGYNIMGV